MSPAPGVGRRLPGSRSLEVYVDRGDAQLMLAGSCEAAHEFMSPTLKELRFDLARLFED